jgi:hypothetical protein
LAEHVAAQAAFRETKLKPCLDAAQAGVGHVFFVDAAHFVFGTFLCCLWSFTRIFIRAASGRQRFNVLGAWNAVTRQLIAVTNTTVVNTETMCELLRKIAALGLTGPITLVLDNARYQHGSSGFRVGKRYYKCGHKPVEKRPKVRPFPSLDPDRDRDLHNERRWPSSDAPDCGSHRSFFNCLNL